jgi:hypothetical protein
MQQTSLGLRNNNPTNLRDEGIPWEGLTGHDENGFCQFIDAAHGLRAGALDTYTKWSKDDLKTAYQIASKRAPASDGNDPQAYAVALAKPLGLGPTDPMDLSTAGNLALVLRAMVMVECGSVPYQASALMAACQAALEAIV